LQLEKHFLKSANPLVRVVFFNIRTFLGGVLNWAMPLQS
jgi:hypothetical protein